MTELRYIEAPWPDTQVRPGAPEILFYEVDDDGDVVLRLVEKFADGALTRNSIEIEAQAGFGCQSLFEILAAEAFADA